jgi:hypothetical protein
MHDELEVIHLGGSGKQFLNFWQAQERARKLAHGDGPATTAPRGISVSIKQALERYEADLKTRGGDIHNVHRLRIHLPPGLAGKSIALLTVDDLRDWRDGLRRPGLDQPYLHRSKGSA